jgi:3-methyladenine DNA glycosylase/8-oxoguanine DNA glycosylase
VPGHRAASLELARRDPVLAGLVARHGPMRVAARPPVAGRFEAIARSIAYQQLAGRAAATIWGRTRAAVEAREAETGRVGPYLRPESVLALDDEVLRGAGLSRAKVAALRDLALKTSTGVVRLDRLGRLSDEEIVAELSLVRGVGEWTAHMFLMFTLHRLDVWPTGDLGVRNGYGRAWGLAEVPTPRELAERGEAFRPYRSVVAWYCWRAVDVVTPD